MYILVVNKSSGLGMNDFFYFSTIQQYFSSEFWEYFNVIKINWN